MAKTSCLARAERWASAGGFRIIKTVWHADGSVSVKIRRDEDESAYWGYFGHN